MRRRRARARSSVTLAAALLLTQPRGFFVLEQGWTEPIAVMMLAVTVFGMSRKRAVAAWAGGLLNVLLPALHYGVPVVAQKVEKFDPGEAYALMARMSVRGV